MIDISDVNVGDQVRIAQENGDEAVFTVTTKSDVYIESRFNTFESECWDTLEILERKFELVPGLYTHYQTDERVVITAEGEAFFTASHGGFVSTVEGSQRIRDAVQEKRGWNRDVAL